MKNLFRFLVIVSLLFYYVDSKEVFSQSESVSPVGSLSIVKEVKPPILQTQGQIAFVDEDGNKAIDAGERCTISLTIKNVGTGDGYGLKGKIRSVGTIPGINIKDVDIPTLKVGSSYTVDFPITADMNTIDGKAEFVLSIEEPNGFNLPDVPVKITTRAFQSPMVAFLDYQILGQSSKITEINTNAVYRMKVLVQNTGYGKAENVNLYLSFPNGVINQVEDNALVNATLESGQSKEVIYSFSVPYTYKSNQLSIDVNLSEKYGKYNKNGTINFDVKGQKDNDYYIVDADIKTNKPIDRIKLSSDVDENIPQTNIKNDYTFAFIIANENYEKTDNVPYALSDGMVFKEYCEKTLGLPAENISFYKNARYSDMIGCMKKIQSITSSIKYKGKSNIIFYYAGHGIPNQKTEDAYLQPVDVDGYNTDICYSIDKLYTELSSLEVNNAIVFMDACFTGKGRNENMILKDRGAAIAAKKSNVKGNVISFVAAEGKQTALQYDEKKHGMFTYFLLKKLQETKGNVTLGELQKYLAEEVDAITRKKNKVQTPVVIISPSLSQSWQKMKLVK